MGFKEDYQISVGIKVSAIGDSPAAFDRLRAGMEKFPGVGAGVVKSLDQILAAEVNAVNGSKLLSSSFKQAFTDMAAATSGTGRLLGAGGFDKGIKDMRTKLATEMSALSRQYRESKSEMNRANRLGWGTGSTYEREHYAKVSSSHQQIKDALQQVGRLDYGLRGMTHTMKDMGSVGKTAFRGIAAESQHLQASIGRTAISMGILYQLKQSLTDSINVARTLISTTKEVETLQQNSKFFGAGGPGYARALRGQTRGLAAQYGVTNQQVANSMQTVVQAADLPTSQSLQIVAVAAQTAVATKSSIETLTDILVAARNALNLKGDEMVALSGKLILMWKEGVITFEQAHNALGKVFQAGSLFGATSVKDMDFLLAAVAAVTKEAGSAERNITYLQNALIEFTKPKAREALAKAGIDFTQGTTPYEQNKAALMQVLEKGPEFIAANFPDVRTKMGLSVLSSELPKLKSIMKEMGNTANLLSEAFDNMLTDPTVKLQKLNARFESLKITLGSDLVAAVDKAVTPTLLLGEALDAVADSDGKINHMTASLRALAEVAGALVVMSTAAMATNALTGLPRAGNMFGTIGTSIYGAASMMGGKGAGLALGQMEALAAARAATLAQGVTMLGSAEAMTLAGGAGGAGLASASAIPIVGAVALAGTAAYLGYNAYSESIKDQRAAAAEAARSQIEDRQAALDSMVAVSGDFAGLQGQYGKAGTDQGGLSRQLHETAAALVEIDAAKAKTYRLGTIEADGSKWVTLNGKIISSVGDLHKAIERLSIDNFKTKLQEMMELSEDYLRNIRGEIDERAASASKAAYSGVQRRFKDFGGRPAGMQIGMGTLSSYYDMSATQQAEFARNQPDIARFIQNFVKSEKENYDNDVPHMYGLSSKVKFPLPWVNQATKPYANELADKESQARKKATDEFLKATDEEAKSLFKVVEKTDKWGQLLDETTDEQGNTTTELKGIAKEAETLFQRMKDTKAEIELQLKYEQQTGVLTADKVDERRKQLEQEKLMPSLLEAAVLKQRDINGETTHQFEVNKQILDYATQIAQEKFSQAEIEKRTTIAAERYAYALETASKGIQESAENAQKAFGYFEDAGNALAGASGFNRRYGEITNRLVDIALQNVPPEMRDKYKSALNVESSNVELQASMADFNMSNEFYKKVKKFGGGAGATRDTLVQEMVAGFNKFKEDVAASSNVDIGAGYPGGPGVDSDTGLEIPTGSSTGYFIPDIFDPQGPGLDVPDTLANDENIANVMAYLLGLPDVKAMRDEIQMILNGEGAFSLNGQTIQLGQSTEEFAKNYAPMFEGFLGLGSSLESGGTATLASANSARLEAAQRVINNLVNVFSSVTDFTSQFNEDSFTGEDAKSNAEKFKTFLESMGSRTELDALLSDSISVIQTILAENPDLAKGDIAGATSLSHGLGILQNIVRTGEMGPEQAAQLAGLFQDWQMNQIKGADDPRLKALAEELGINAEFWARVYGENAPEIESAYKGIAPALRAFTTQVQQAGDSWLSTLGLPVADVLTGTGESYSGDQLLVPGQAAPPIFSPNDQPAAPYPSTIGPYPPYVGTEGPYPPEEEPLIIQLSREADRASSSTGPYSMLGLGYMAMINSQYTNQWTGEEQTNQYGYGRKQSSASKELPEGWEPTCTSCGDDPGWINVHTGAHSDTRPTNSTKGEITGSITPGGAYGGRPIKYSMPGTASKEGGGKAKQGENWAANLSFLGSAIQAYFSTLINGGTKEQAARAAKLQIATGAGNMVGGMVGRMAGPFGAILGPLAGGLVSYGLSKLFKLNKPVEHEKPVLVKVVNVLDFIRFFSLPSSHYFAPSGRNMQSPVNLNQQNNFHVDGGPKVATRIASALTGLSDSLAAGFG